MATIKDIARAVGVSPTTVSNVIHGNAGRVSAETVRRINEAIGRMNYVPNLSARALVSNSSRIVGVINHLVPVESGGFFQDPFHGALLAGIDLALRERDYYLMVRTINTVPELTNLVTHWNLDGLILTGLFPQDFYQSLLRQPCPFLLIDSYINNPKVLQIRLEDRQGGYLATRHLLENGHRDILFCSPTIREGGVVSERYYGYKQALAEYGIERRPENIYEGEIGIAQATALGRRLAGRGGFTAIFATADILAAGLISGLNAGGLRVPEDVSIVGFDDLNISQLTSPHLTTIHQDVVEKGMTAVRTLLSAIAREAFPAPITFPVRLIERQSVAKRQGA
ncbi:MAG: LacI family transcriptional regulator [Oscillospiraceae bacterium]|nr:LacI family transcriptional regulator [Oscillospiraceae bacterium]